MIRLAAPSKKCIQRFLHEQATLPFAYAEVGGSRLGAPRGYSVRHNRILLGHGDAAFDRAIRALQRWETYDFSWVRLYPSTPPIRRGEVFAVRARQLDFYSLSAARIVYTVAEPTRYGFAIGTLPGHVERGEERFLVERLPDGSVWYDLFAFSKPGHPLVRLGWPFGVYLQKRFARESQRAMQRAVR